MLNNVGSVDALFMYFADGIVVLVINKLYYRNLLF